MRQKTHGRREAIQGRLFMTALVLPVVIGLTLADVRNPGQFDWKTLVWLGIVASVELLPVSVNSQLQLTLGFPILLGVAILYPPTVAATIALLGSFDARELRRAISPLKAGFNRAQIALATLAGSFVFHSSVTASKPSLVALILGSLAATISNYAVNTASVVLAMRLLYGMPFARVFAQMRFGALSQFLLNYLGLSFIGVIIARLYGSVGLWSVAAFILPLVFARQMFFRTMALEEASKELKDRERVLRALSNRMAEERQDERMQIAAYLHDDLAQMLFRLNLQVEMAKKRLAVGDLESVLKDLQGINETKEQTNVAIRALIRDLHRSPIGRHGLAEAIESFAIDSSKGSSTSIATDVVDVSLPPPIQLLIYQIAREGAMNALKHAGAGNIWISLREHDDGVELQIRDDGKGFDTDAPPPEGHFGSVMMRERALVAGGTFAIRSEAGRGTIISATFPRVWVEEGTLLESFVQPTSHDGTEPLTAPSEDSDQRSRRLLGRFRRRSPDAAPVSAGHVDTTTQGATARDAGGNAEATTVEASAIETLGQQVSPLGEPDSDPEQADRDRRAVRT